MKKIFETDITNSPIDMTYKGKDVLMQALAPIAEPDKSDPPRKGDKNYLARRGVVRFSYTSKVYREGFENVCKNIMMLKQLKDNPKALDSAMESNNSRRVDYIARARAAIEPAPEGFLEDPEKPLYNYVGGRHEFTTDDAKKLLGNGATFSIILSVEDRNVDLSYMTACTMREFFRHVDGDPKGWVAANHYNTEHPHSHIIISREDAETGKELYLSKTFLRNNTLKNTLDNVLFKMYGLRSVEEAFAIEASYIKSDEFTNLDKTILRHAKERPDGYLHVDNNLKGEKKEKKAKVHQRLWYLHEKGLAEYDGISDWKIDSSFSEALHIEQARKIFSLPKDAKCHFITEEEVSKDEDIRLVDIEELENSDKNLALYECDGEYYFVETSRDVVELDHDYSSYKSHYRGGRD